MSGAGQTTGRALPASTSDETVGWAAPTKASRGLDEAELGRIPADWSVRSLGSLCMPPTGFIQTGPFGSQLHASDYVSKGIPIVNPTHMDSNKVRHAHIPLVSEADARRLDRHRLTVGDILFSRRGDVGRHAYVSKEENGWLCGTGCLLVRPTPGTVDSLYLSYFLSTEPIQDYLTTHAVGSIMPNINTKILDALPVTVPPHPEQRAIAAVLSKIQAAVAVQDKIVATLKELKAATMAKLFREGLYGEPLKQTEIGEVPESWEVVRLGDVARIGNGSTPKRTNPAYWEGGTLPWLTSTKVHDVVIREPSALVTELAAEECHLPIVPKGSIVVAITGQGKTLGNAALVAFDTRINQHLAFIHVDDPRVAPGFVLTYLLSRYEDLRQAGMAGGSTKAALTCAYLETYPIAMPPLEQQGRIANAVLTIADKQGAAERQRDTLRSLFSTTLHLLMTGQVRVNQLRHGKA